MEQLCPYAPTLAPEDQALFLLPEKRQLAVKYASLVPKSQVESIFWWFDGGKATALYWQGFAKRMNI